VCYTQYSLSKGNLRKIQHGAHGGTVRGPQGPPRPFELVWSRLALPGSARFGRTLRPTSQQPQSNLQQRIVAVVEALKHHPFLGRSSSIAGGPEFLIGGTLYIILYRVRGRRVVVQTIWHGAQRNKVTIKEPMAKGVGDKKVAGHQDLGVGDVDHGVASSVAHNGDVGPLAAIEAVAGGGWQPMVTRKRTGCW